MIEESSKLSLSNSFGRIVSLVKSIKFIPSVLVLLFDLFILIFFLSIFYLVLENLYFLEMTLQDFTFWSLAVLFLFSLFMYFFKSYRSFLRYTEFYELIRVAAVFFFSFSAFFILNQFAILFSWEINVPLFFILFVYLMSFVALSTYRLIVKEFYFYLNRESKASKKVVIYGTDFAAITLYRLFKRDLNYRNEVVAFFDENLPESSKEIFGLKVYYDLDQLELCLTKFKVDELIISSDSLSIDKKQLIFQICHNHSVEIKFFPSIAELKTTSADLSNLCKLRLEDLLGRPTIQIDQNHLTLNLNNRVILVSGAGGSIGSELCRQICKYPIKQLLLLDFDESALFEIHQELLRKYPGKDIEAVLCDIRSNKDLEEVFKKFRPDFVLHAAAYKHVPLMEAFPKLAVQTNIIGTKILADLSIKYRVLKFLLVSTDKAVNPTNVMGASKRCAELYIQSKAFTTGSDHATEFVVTRFGNVLGSNGSVIPLFTKQIENGGPVTVTHPDIVRFFMTIPEACSLVLEAFSMGKAGNVFVFDMGNPVRILDLAEKMIKLSGKKPYEDIAISFTGLRPGEKLYEELFNKDEVQSTTYNPKIFIINTNLSSLSRIDSNLQEIQHLLEKNGDGKALIKMIKKILPEYKSAEADYVELDRLN